MCVPILRACRQITQIILFFIKLYIRFSVGLIVFKCYVLYFSHPAVSLTTGELQNWDGVQQISDLTVHQIVANSRINPFFVSFCETTAGSFCSAVTSRQRIVFNRISYISFHIEVAENCILRVRGKFLHNLIVLQKICLVEEQ